MGVVYKLKPQLKEFIIKEKKNRPQISCRKLAKLAEGKFKVSVSKSSINLILKEAGLSMSVGRRRKKSFSAPKGLDEIRAKLREEPKSREPRETKPVSKPVKPVADEADKPLSSAPVQPPVSESVKTPLGEPVEPPASEPIKPPSSSPVQPPEPVSPPEPLPEELIPKPEPIPEEMLSPPEPQITPPVIEKDSPQAMPLMPFETERQQVESPKAKKPELMHPEAAGFPTIEEGKTYDCPGAILLKAADYLIGGSFYFADAIRQYIRLSQFELLAKTEGAIYKPLCEMLKIDKSCACLWPFLFNVFSPEELSTFMLDLKNNQQLILDLKQLTSHIFQEVRCVQINYADGSSLYLDGQLHTIWSSPHIPYSFVTPMQNLKNYINNCFFSSKPFVIFTAPGYDVPPREFFSFMLSFESAVKKASRMHIFSNKLEEVGVVPLEEGSATQFVFGLWPWQFGHFRKVLTLKEDQPFYEEMSKQNFYIAEIEIELVQPDSGDRIQLKGCALKKSPNEKIQFVILSNIRSGKTPQDLAKLYLERWPNLEEAFQDYSRKIELFTYTASPSADVFSTENQDYSGIESSEISQLFSSHLKILDTFVRTYFLPFGYENKDFSAASERFYQLKATAKIQKGVAVVTFQPPPDYKFLPDLAYACRRVNEREVVLPPGNRLWLEVASG